MNHKSVCGQIRPLELMRFLQVKLSLRPGLGLGGWGEEVCVFAGL